MRGKFLRWAALALALAAPLSAAARPGAPVFRCPGAPVLYVTDARLADARGCVAVSAASGARTGRAAAARPVPAGSETVATATDPERTGASGPRVVATALQRERDTDRMRILQAEQARESERLADLHQRLAAARSGSAKDRDAAPELERAIGRSEEDLAAIGRELARAGS
jgi:hypothetical protein